MKISHLLSIVLLAVLVTETNAQSLPRSEYAIQLEKNTVVVKPGTTTELVVNILRSKSYSKAKAHLGLSSALPEGMLINFEPAVGTFQSSVATLTLAETVKPGNYQIIVKGELNRKIKGVILKIEVLDRKSSEVVTIN